MEVSEAGQIIIVYSLVVRKWITCDMLGQVVRKITVLYLPRAALIQR